MIQDPGRRTNPWKKRDLGKKWESGTWTQTRERPLTSETTESLVVGAVCVGCQRVQRDWGSPKWEESNCVSSVSSLFELGRWGRGSGGVNTGEDMEGWEGAYP